MKLTAHQITVLKQILAEHEDSVVKSARIEDDRRPFNATSVPEIVKLVNAVDNSVKRAEKAILNLVKACQRHQHTRATMVASFMEARGITYETAQCDYSRMRRMLNDPDFIKDFEAGLYNLQLANFRKSIK